MLKVENLSKIYEGGTQALDDVSFEVEPGEFLAIIGLSGSGKSTLLRCINRLIEPTSGTITWDGVDVTKASQEELRRIRRKIGMVFQHFNLVNRSQVLTNVLSGRLGYLNPALSRAGDEPPPDHHGTGGVESMLKVENLSKIYEGGTQALDDVSFEVEPGEFLAIIGLSGSGKSTLLRCINRLIEPTSGTITWDGVDITKASQEELRRIRRRIGMVFQHFNLVNRSQVLTNVLSGRLGYLNPALSLVNRFPKADIDKAHAQLARVGLEEKWDARADELSGGQKQRVGVARAMMQDPEIMLADEPVASLDPVLARSIMQYLERINQEDGAMVLCSLHFLDLVHEYADRVIALNDGKLVFEGLPSEIDDEKFNEIYGQEAERIG